jgi:hypothetical protein
VRTLLAAVVLVASLTLRLSAQTGAVALLVIDDATDAGVPDVHVSIAGQTGEGVTDARGRFTYFGARPGTVIVYMRRLGYNPGALTVSVSAGDTARVTYAMTVAPQTLSSVEVRDTATMVSRSRFLADFERRVAVHAGSATYITRADIDKRRPSQTTDLLRRVSSISIADSLGVLMAISRRVQKPVIRAGTSNLANCPLQVAVDGQLKEWGYAVNSLSPNEIHGIEVYPGPATIPAEYASMRRDAACGLILIWTRRDK